MKVGVWGGTFDPVHNGHLTMMRESRKAMGFDRVIVMPSHIPPHKKPLASSEQRLHMLQLTLEQDPCFMVDTRELEAPNVSYSLLSCQQLVTEYAGHELYFCMGADSYATFDRWYRWQQLSELINIVVVSRPGSKAVNDTVQHYRETHCERLKAIVHLHLSLVDVSSTDIRAALKHHRDCSALLPESVLQFIQHNNVYL